MNNMSLDTIKELSHDEIEQSRDRLHSNERRELRHNSYYRHNLYQQVQQGYLEALETMILRQESLQRKSSLEPPAQTVASKVVVPQAHFKLPRLPLKTFDGSLLEWLPFKDFFVSSIISSQSLDDVERLHYLKSSLTGSAAQFLKNTTLVAENFKKSWEALVSFYKNKRLLTNASVNALFSLKRMSKESASELEALYSSVTQHYRMLETLERPVHH
ncbi:uncharacterized protein LOC123272905 [Cotesia glomerata]|uniref:uncharacterized protein LOC123272905 n=1 Tax=Cotesia glomerata TaxID=32391 RepID=UPI001D005944|nr:uncharacterized protein LOC123272905 [Cotesia glomerata]